MKKIINKIKNYHPSKWEALCFLFLPIFVGILCATRLDNDTWFLMNYGRYICNHGFPSVDSFTIHEGLHLVVQQWVVDVLFYQVYHFLGKIGLFFLVNLVNLYLVFITYQLLMVVTEKKRNLSILFTGIIISLFDFCFLTSRPQIFSAAILLTELYFLESYTKTKNKKYLYGLPLLSFLMINFHASMFWMVFCFYLPFLVNTFSFHLGNLKSEGGDKKIFLFILLFMILAGFINPYGIHSITYLFTSYNVKWIYETVNEMRVPSIHSLLGIFSYFCIFSVYLLYLVFLKNKMKISHFLLLIGTTYIAISSNRGLEFFLLASIYPISFYLKDSFYLIKEPKRNQKLKYYFIGCGFFFFLFPFFIMMHKIHFSTMEIEGVKTLAEQEKIEDIRLFCRYEYCNYAEYLGIKTYSDSRAEVFLKANNQKEDIMEELYQLQHSQLDLDAFLEKYQFTHFLVTPEDTLYQKLYENSSYQIIYQKNSKNKKNEFQYLIFKKIEE